MNKNRRGYEGYKRTGTDGREDVICEPCGVTIKARGMSRHKKGVAHRQNKRIRALLNKPCVTQQAIAERVGVTRQRVQQVAAKLGVDGVSRYTVCVVERAKVRREDLFKTHIAGLALACEQQGLSVKPILANDKISAPFFRKKVEVNGHVCLLRVAWRYVCNPRYIVLRTPPDLADAQFILYVLPDNRWMVVPRESLPNGSTLFALEVTDHRELKSTLRHDWRNYIDAWHLLATKQQSVAA